MNLLLYAMRCTEPNDDYLEFLRTSEVLVEIGDDLTDYAEDVERNSFNIYRCFLNANGPDRGRQEMQRFIKAAEADYAAALGKLEAGVAAEWRDKSAGMKRHLFTDAVGVLSSCWPSDGSPSST